MSGAVIEMVRLTPTHDGEAAIVVELRFPGGGLSTVQIDASGLRAVMKNAAVDNADDLIGRSWTVLDVHNPIFL